MNMRIPKPIPRGRPGGPVFPDVLIQASSVWATEPRPRSGVNRATALMLSSSPTRPVQEGAATPLVLRLEREENCSLEPPFPSDRGWRGRALAPPGWQKGAGDQPVDETEAAPAALRLACAERWAALCARRGAGGGDD